MTQPSSRRATALILALTALTALAVLAAAHAALQDPELQPVNLHIEKVGFWNTWRDTYLAQLRAAPERCIALLGDSVMMHGDAELQDVPRHLEQALARLAPDRQLRIAPLVWPGQTMLERYFMADALVSSGVHNVLIALNLVGLTPQAMRGWTAIDLVGLLPPTRLAQTFALPLADVGIGLDQVVLHKAVSASGAFEPFRLLRRDQARAATFLERAQGRLRTDPDARTPLLTFMYLSRLESASDQSYSAALAGLERDHVGVQMLEASLRVYRERGARVVVFVDPIDLELLESRGFMNERARDGLRRTLATLAAVVRENGAELIDLHALLPRDGFDDRAGHLTFRAPVHGNRRLAEELAPRIYRSFFESP